MSRNINIHLRKTANIPSLSENILKEDIHEVKQYLTSQMEIFFGNEDLKYFSFKNFFKSIEQIKNLTEKKEFISFLNDSVIHILFNAHLFFHKK